MSEAVQITDAEWVVMRAVWLRDAQSAGEIVAEVQANRDWSRRTIRTLLSRLVERGAVGVRVAGGQQLYRALVTNEACLRVVAKSFSQRLFSGDVKSLLMHFVASEPISDEELEQIRKRLRSKACSSKASRRRRS